MLSMRTHIRGADAVLLHKLGEAGLWHGARQRVHAKGRERLVPCAGDRGRSISWARSRGRQVGRRHELGYRIEVGLAKFMLSCMRIEPRRVEVVVRRGLEALLPPGALELGCAAIDARGVAPGFRTRARVPTCESSGLAWGRASNWRSWRAGAAAQGTAHQHSFQTSAIRRPPLRGDAGRG